MGVPRRDEPWTFGQHLVGYAMSSHGRSTAGIDGPDSEQRWRAAHPTGSARRSVIRACVPEDAALLPHARFYAFEYITLRERRPRGALVRPWQARPSVNDEEDGRRGLRRRGFRLHLDSRQRRVSGCAVPESAPSGDGGGREGSVGRGHCRASEGPRSTWKWRGRKRGAQQFFDGSLPGHDRYMMSGGSSERNPRAPRVGIHGSLRRKPGRRSSRDPAAEGFVREERHPTLRPRLTGCLEDRPPVSKLFVAAGRQQTRTFAVLDIAWAARTAECADACAVREEYRSPGPRECGVRFTSGHPPSSAAGRGEQRGARRLGELDGQRPRTPRIRASPGSRPVFTSRARARGR